MKEKIEFRENIRKMIETLPDMTAEKMEKMLDYAEWHANAEVAVACTETLLPQSLFVMNKLNLKGKRVILATDTLTHEINVKMPLDDIDHYQFDVSQVLLHKISEMLVEKINAELEGAAGIRLHMIFSSAQCMSERDAPHKLIAYGSKYTVIK